MSKAGTPRPVPAAKAARRVLPMAVFVLASLFAMPNGSARELPTPTVPHVTTVSPSALGSPSAAGAAVLLGGARLVLPTGWVAKPVAAALPSWCLLAAAEPVPRETDDCPVLFARIPEGGGGLSYLVDVPGVVLQGSVPPCRGGRSTEQLLGYAETSFGGRPADYRRWQFGCTNGTHYQVEQFVVDSGPGYLAYSQHADAAIHSIMAQLAATATLPARTTALRYSDFGIVRSLSHRPDGLQLTVDRVVDSAGTLINGSPTSYPYLVPYPAIRSQQQIGVGSTVALLTDGVGVLALYHWTPAIRYDLSAGNSAADHGCVPAPAATDGRLTLDRTSVRPGDTAIGVLSDFRQWPQGIIGGGSGETFKFCNPWQPYRDYLVLFHDTAALFLIHVPVGTKPGSYPISVRFFKDAASSSDLGFQVGLTASLTVTTTPRASSGVSPACALHHAASPFGALSAPGSVQSGHPLSVSVTGVGKVYPFSESQRLYFVACLAGQATAVTFPGDPGRSFTVPVPAGLRPGSYDLVVTGWAAANPESGAAIRSWHRSVTVTQPPVLPATGVGWWQATVAGAALIGAGCWLQFVAARHRRRSWSAKVART